MSHRFENTHLLDKPVFTVSIDFELMWGTADRPYSGKFRKICQAERDHVIGRLLDLAPERHVRADSICPPQWPNS